MNAALLGLLGAAGAVYVMDDTTSPKTPRPALPPSSGTRVGALSMSTRPSNPTVTTSPYLKAPYASTANGLSGEAELTIRRRLEAEYNALTGEAKRAACERLKKQFPDDSNVQGLNCAGATFQQVVTVVSAAVGTALCGPTCGALGVIAAQYFGEDLNRLWNDFEAKLGGGQNPFAASVCRPLAQAGRLTPELESGICRPGTY